MAWRSLTAPTPWSPAGHRTKNRRAARAAGEPSRRWRSSPSSRSSPRRPYLFGRRGQAPFCGWSQSKARLDRRIAEQQGAPLAAGTSRSAPDLRKPGGRARARRAARIEAILNHVSGHRTSVAGIYNRATYREPKRIGLQRWADWWRGGRGPPPAANVVRWRADAQWPRIGSGREIERDAGWRWPGAPTLKKPAFPARRRRAPADHGSPRSAALVALDFALEPRPRPRRPRRSR